LNLKIADRSVPSGRSASIALIFSRMSATMPAMSVPQRKLTSTSERPSEEVDETFSMPLRVETASSMGRVTPDSTSKGPTPG
jgi:hypothetical protein